MIEANDTIFPNNIVKYIAAAAGRIDSDVRVLPRPLRDSDPKQSIGVHAQMWTPDDESIEMQGLGQPGVQMPTIQRYDLAVQAFVKDSSVERGLAVHSVLSARVRAMLYTDPDLQVVLGQLSADLGNGWSESMRRWGVRGVRYFSGEIDAQFLYLSTLEFWIQTETRRTN